MPTVLRIGPYRFFFYSSDREEPVHVHVERERAIAKFWIRPVSVAHSRGFTRSELRDLQRIVEESREEIERKWNEYFV